MRWCTNAGRDGSVRDLWDQRGDGLIFLDDADGVDLLRKALPAPLLDWIQVGNEWAISITSAYVLWMDMINMPSVKDVGWAGTGYSFDEKLIDPTLVFARCCLHGIVLLIAHRVHGQRPACFHAQLGFCAGVGTMDAAVLSSGAGRALRSRSTPSASSRKIRPSPR